MSVPFDVPPPIDGDPSTISDFAGRYAKIAAALSQAASELQALANSDVNVGKSITAVQEKALSVQSDTYKVAKHYSGASATYLSYSSSLEEAQKKGETARKMISSFQGDAVHLQQRHQDLVHQAQSSMADQQTADDLKAATSQLSTYKSDWTNAMKIYSAALEDKRSAVLTAVAQLEEAASASGLKDSTLDIIKGGLHDLYEAAQKYLAPLLVKIRAVLKLIQAVLDTLSFIASFIPIPLVKAVIVAAALAVALASLQCSLILLVLGRGDLSQVIGDAIDTATSVLALVTPAAGVVGGIIKSALKDAGKDAVKSAAINVLGTDLDSNFLLTSTLPDPFVDSTAPPWGSSDPIGHESQIPAGFKDEIVRDFYKGLPGVNIISAYQDNIVPAFSGTGS